MACGPPPLFPLPPCSFAHCVKFPLDLAVTPRRNQCCRTESQEVDPLLPLRLTRGMIVAREDACCSSSPSGSQGSWVLTFRGMREAVG